MSMLKSIRNLLLGKSETELKFVKAIDELNLLSQASSIDSESKLLRIIEDENHMLTGTVKIGLNEVKMEVLFDTGSDWLVIYSNKCKNCNGKKYSPITSTKVSTAN
jgi:hypothetical protein